MSPAPTTTKATLIKSIGVRLPPVVGGGGVGGIVGSEGGLVGVAKTAIVGVGEGMLEVGAGVAVGAGVVVPVGVAACVGVGAVVRVGTRVGEAVASPRTCSPFLAIMKLRFMVNLLPFSSVDVTVTT